MIHSQLVDIRLVHRLPTLVSHLHVDPILSAEKVQMAKRFVLVSKVIQEKFQIVALSVSPTLNVHQILLALIFVVSIHVQIHAVLMLVVKSETTLQSVRAEMDILEILSFSVQEPVR